MEENINSIPQALRPFLKLTTKFFCIFALSKMEL